MRWPPYHLAHVRRLTDPTGMVEHAVGAVPNPHEGYTLDDNARALVAVLRYHQACGQPEAVELAFRYLSFLLYCQREDGWFHNDVGYDRRFLDEQAPEEPVGRAVWALAEAACRAPVEALRQGALRMLLRSWPKTFGFQHLRPVAYGLLAAATLARGGPELPGHLARQAREMAWRWGRKLLRAYVGCAQARWRWFEPRMTYCNALLPHGLVAAWQVSRERRFLAVALQASEFLWESLWDGRVVHVVGNRGWWERGSAPARFDQQPVDAGAMAELWVALHAATGDRRYLRRACLALEWFYGRNAGGVAMYDPETGGCRDGLGPDGPNPNQGAEATLSHLMARMAVEQALAQVEPASQVAMA